ncbi:HD-GYP domain-containing protein [Fervidobacterium thailandense]|uniref:HD-GYP domain-containing protein n=1 Tax=Fervidobacterium thailandense TaxID=1008305 RepID=UPI00084601F5|nr:HD-GYP domain-containing protein [Fervidobacterium thailandense]
MNRREIAEKLINVTPFREFLRRWTAKTLILLILLLGLNVVAGFYLSKTNFRRFVLFSFVLIVIESFIIKEYFFSRKSMLMKNVISPLLNLTDALSEQIRSNLHRGDINVKSDIWEINRFAEDIKYFIESYVELLQENDATKQQLQAVYSEVHLAYRNFHEAYINFAKRLSIIAEAYDEQTGNHIERVGVLSAFVAEKLGLDGRMVELIRNFAPLHDIGKLLVPKDILNKPGRLTPEEFEEVKKHTLYGAQLIGDDPFFEVARNIALYHHEKFDGSGYPFGLKGDEIPIEAQIVAVVDVYDALRSRRSYKKELSHEEAMVVLLGKDERTSFTHFNPRILSIFVKYSEEIKMLWDSVSFSSSQLLDVRRDDRLDISKTS